MGRFGKRTVLSAVAGTAAIVLPCAALASSSGARAVKTDALAVKAKATPYRVISYHGYQLRVPGSWPVYRLAENPSRCVLFNRHAVYLGRPGADQSCPARAFGRTEAVLVEPMGSPGNLPAGTVMERGRGAGGWSAGPLAAGNATAHILRIALPAADVLVTATYGRDPALVRGMLDGARLTPAAGPARPAVRRPSRSGSARPRARRHGIARPGAAGHVAARHDAAWHNDAARKESRAAAAGILTGEPGSGLGFDTCTVPSIATMTKWLTSPFRVVGTYLGGVNWACDYGNFSRSWAREAATQGWRFIPIWVGPQAPCSTIPGVTRINPSQARTEGESEAASAVATAARFGYGTGSPIYFDMEAYNNTVVGCTGAVLSFLDGWTRGLHSAHYASGVYSSAASGIADLDSKVGKRAYALPDDIWFADWNDSPSLSDHYVPGGDWARHQRVHQYRGPHVETWGGASVNIDRDVIDGEVAGLRSASVSPDASLLAQPGIAEVYPGTTNKVQLTVGGTADTPSDGSRVRWKVRAPAGLTISPDHGSVSVLRGKQEKVTLRVRARSSAVPGRHNLPITATADGQPMAESYELVSVVRPHHALPTAEPLVLYAADHASMALAVQTARRLALPASDVTGSFRQAWTDVAGGNDLLFAVGKAALHGLYTNPCGWSNPAGAGGGHTPFSLIDVSLRRPAGANIFENAAAHIDAEDGQLTAEMTRYALTGTPPDGGTSLPAPALPTRTCMGSPNVRVP